MARALFFALTVLLASTSLAAAGETYTQIKSRGVLRCGVGDAVPGMAQRGEDGAWRGMEADFCRAAAAAVLGDAGKVSFLPLETAGRFPALLGKQVDLLMRSTTWTIGREAQLKVTFAGPLLFTGQRFLTRTAENVRTLEELDGATVCLAKGTTHEQGLASLAQERGIRLTPQVFDSVEQALEAFGQGRCRALSADGLVLAGFLSQMGKEAADFALLPGVFSEEPLAPVMRSDDNDWLLAVRGVLAALVSAEARGLTQQTARAALGGDQAALGAAASTLAARADALAKPLGMPSGWLLRAVAASGNYGEMFERNLGAQSPLKLPRGFNGLWSRGGLLYAVPF